MSVVDVIKVDHAGLDRRLLGRAIDVPTAGVSRETHDLCVSGWVVSAAEPVVAVALLYGGRVLQQAPIDRARPDVLAAVPGAAGDVGFYVNASVLGLPEAFDIEVVAVLQNTARVLLGTIRGKRQRLSSNHADGIQPLIVTTLGRTGSTWLTHLLSQHPQVVAYRPFQLEPQVARYWMQVLTTLADPRSYLRSLTAPDVSAPDWWLPNGGVNGNDTSSVHRHMVDVAFRQFTDFWATDPDPELRRWLGYTAVQELADLCQQRINGFYRHLATTQGRTQAAYFIEKVIPNHVLTSVVHELYPQARELFLVRDFRDVLCSMIAFGHKHGQTRRPEAARQVVTELSRSAVRLAECARQRGEAGLVVRYEDLILEPEATLKSVLGFLAVDDRAETIAAVVAGARRISAELQQGHQTSSDPAASIGRWRRELDPDLQQACAELLGQPLKQFGYDVPELPPKPARPVPQTVAQEAP